MSKPKGKRTTVKPEVKKYSTMSTKYQVQDRQTVKGKQPLFDVELAVDESALYLRLKLTPYTPDELLTKKKIDIFNKMMTDPEIEGAVDELKLLRLSSGYEIKSASDSVTDRYIRDFVEWNLDNLEGSFLDDLRDIMGGVEMGMSMQEEVWESGTYPNWQGSRPPALLRALKSKNPKFYNIWTDDFDNIQRYGVVNISTFDYGRHYPADKFVIYTPNKRYENVWGVSRIRSLYDLWYIKQIALRAWGIFLEAFGHPFPVIKHPKGLDQRTKNYLLTVIKQIRLETGLTLPQGVDYELVESSGRSADVHEQIMRWINDQIRKKVLGQTLGGDNNKGAGGNRASDEVKFDVLMLYVENIGVDMAKKAVNDQIIKRIVDYNFEGVTEYPEFVFKPMSKEDVSKKVDSYLSAIQSKALQATPEDEEVLREWLELPARNVEKNPAGAALNPDAPLQTNSDSYVFVAYADKLFTGVDRRKFTTYEECTDFGEIKLSHDELFQKYLVQTSVIVKGGINEMLKKIQQMQIVEKKDFTAIKNIVFPDTGNLKLAFNNLLTETFDNAQRTARSEISKKKRQRSYSEAIAAKSVKIVNLHEAGIKLLKKNISRFDDLDLRKITPTDALNWFDVQSFQMAGVEKTEVENQIKQILSNAIRTGATVRDTINEIQDQMAEYYNPAADDTFDNAHLATVIRTNTTAAMNEGRKMFFENPELDGYVVAYQYSAVMDDRVRPNHACMDGRKYRVTSSVWDSHTPPMGYNCRCLLIPVTQQEKWEEDRRPGVNCDPDEGFGAPGQ